MAPISWHQSADTNQLALAHLLGGVVDWELAVGDILDKKNIMDFGSTGTIVIQNNKKVESATINVDMI